MEDEIKLLRALAVQRFRAGESPDAICTSLGKSRFWLYKWVNRFDEADAYPALPSLLPNQTHQADFVGPCYLKGGVRFYSLNVVDTTTVRCGIYPSGSTAAQSVVDGFWSIWMRIGIPERLQQNNVQPWFIPMAEPWRNAMVENFNERYQQRFLGKVVMESMDVLQIGSTAFEHRHNSRYRYSKLKGGTPLKALAATGAKLRFPVNEKSPKHPLIKPEVGKYHVVRMIRSDLKLDIFGERFQVPPETLHQYVVATIDVKEQKLKLFLDKVQVDQSDYSLR